MKDNVLISTKSTFTWNKKQSECLSIIDGPFYNFVLDDIQFIVYIPFITKEENYLELINDIYRVRDGICELSKKNNYCSKETIKSISIIPKSLSSSSASVFDTVNLNGHYLFSVNLFADVGYKPITKHISELIAVQISYRMLEDDKLSIFFGQYLIELLDIESLGYIDWMVENHEIDIEIWEDYKVLNTTKKKEYLRSILWGIDKCFNLRTFL
ncbi:hypothetical protein [Virgibacillus pantothenticus]|uniref:hypothetical protein n=1 Tax=Virgibacillus pantothenticus TaxID=1473 RepID=UPI0009866F0F|nr:hypothetical protein [Virgibacillus pantothenticus]